VCIIGKTILMVMSPNHGGFDGSRIDTVRSLRFDGKNFLAYKKGLKTALKARKCWKILIWRRNMPERDGKAGASACDEAPRKFQGDPSVSYLQLPPRPESFSHSAMSAQARPFLRIFTDTGSPVRAQHVSQTEFQEVDSSPGPQEVRPDSNMAKMPKSIAGESGVHVRSGVFSESPGLRDIVPGPRRWPPDRLREESP
jgi:hypothetical protein